MREFTASDFCKAFLSQLVLVGDRVLEPKSLENRRGFQNLINVLDVEANRAEGGADRNWYKQIVRLRNALQASNNGAFESFETKLRDLQTSSVMHPNPKYEHLTIEISPSFATAILDRLDERARRLVEDATNAFEDGKRNPKRVVAA